MKTERNIRRGSGFYISLLVSAISLFLTDSSASAKTKSDEAQWCSIEPEADSGARDWVKLADEFIHIVRPSMQMVAKSRLSKAASARIEEQDASKYLRDSEHISDGRRLYLVRAAAWNLDDNYNIPKVAFGRTSLVVVYSPSRRELSIADFTLGSGGPPPKNFAMLVEVPGSVEKSHANCSLAK